MGNRPSRTNRGQHAFTLIELLVVTAILGVVVGAVGACLAGGIRVWDVARRFNQHEADALMGFQIMRRDMGQVLPFESAPLEGTTDGLRFTGVGVVPVAGESDDALPRLAIIRYFLDYERQAWCRAIAPLGWGEAQSPEVVEVLVSDVDRVALRYGAAPEDDAGSATGWSDSWENPTNLPAVVEAELSVGDTSMTQWFIVPLAGGGG
ncbi:MAG: prepilin-type N-terminal cleavage/methylation domain-containing protein [Kiritimatiellia bacterium]|nr:prepilin-type N-terminal cleavage/methylation domain-containing protein [Kiritimatiellia bacterium]